MLSNIFDGSNREIDIYVCILVLVLFIDINFPNKIWSFIIIGYGLCLLCSISQNTIIEPKVKLVFYGVIATPIILHLLAIVFGGL